MNKEEIDNLSKLKIGRVYSITNTTEILMLHNLPHGSGYDGLRVHVSNIKTPGYLYTVDARRLRRLLRDTNLDELEIK